MMMTIMQAGIIIVFAEPLKGYLEAKPGKMSSALYSRVSGWGGANEKMWLIVWGRRCGNYIKTDNSLCIKLPLQHIIMATLLRD